MAMQAEIRRIDLTTEPATVDAWPSIDWLASTAGSFGATASEHVAPRGRGGLWDAMAKAVQRAREASVSDEVGMDAEVVTLTVDAPHLAYLARVAAGAAHADVDGPGAEVIALDDARFRDVR